MSKLPSYERLKDSGIEWAGAIPEHWRVVRGKSFLTQLSRPVSEDDEIVTCFRDGEVTLRKNRREQGFTNALKEIGYQGVETDDLVVHGMDGFAGAIGVSDSRGKVSPVLNVLGCTQNKRYVMYYLRSLSYRDVFMAMSTGIRVRSCDLRWNKLAVLPYLIPPIAEQDAITVYIDSACADIDAIVAESKASIEDYKLLKQSIITQAVTKGLDPSAGMKDSGVDWIGEIPKKWRLSKIKYVADFNPKLEVVFDPSLPVGYTPMECIKNGYMIPQETAYATLSTGLTCYQSGDIVMAKVTPCFENGNIAIADGLTQDVAFGSSELFSFRNKGILKEFLFFYLQSEGFKNKCIATMTGTGGLKRVSGYFVKNANIPVPPVETQKAIADYITTQCEAIEALVSEKQSTISDLEAYKRSLIYEAVTGKRKVV